MCAPSQKQITQMLVDWENGDEAPLEKLTPLVYEPATPFGSPIHVRDACIVSGS